MYRHTIHIFCLVTGVLFSPSVVNSDAFDKGKIQAAYIYNFINFTTWPQAETQPNIAKSLTVCLYGKDGITHELSRLNGEYIRGKKVAIKRAYSATELISCHVLYISPEQSGMYQDLIQLTSGLPILSVGNDKQLLEAGGLITLTQINGKQRININLQTLERSGLSLSSKLLALAILKDE